MLADSSTLASWPEEYARLRDERDFYRSLSVEPLRELDRFVAQATETLDEVRAALQGPARDRAAYRSRLNVLSQSFHRLEQLCGQLELPSFRRRIGNALQLLQEQRASELATGDELLPVLEIIDDLACHVTLAHQTLHFRPTSAQAEPVETAASAADEHSTSRALQLLAARIAVEQGKDVQLAIAGVADIPEAWRSTLFDVLGQLLRLSIEDSVESIEARAAYNKPQSASIVIDFQPPTSDERCSLLSFHDDGRGLGKEHLPTIASLRESLLRLGGKLDLSSKRGQYCRVMMHLPALPAPER
ncbi:MAG TPA: hypothetical protein VMI92_10940 [Steroidobacteraceae bacterium]|nr:hypothetical protein [Steroidobacteraceae bacterium]